MPLIRLLVLGEEKLASKDRESEGDAHAQDEESSNEVGNLDHYVHVSSASVRGCALMGRWPVFL